MNIRVLSYNIHKGFSVTNRKFILSSIKEAIKSVDADIVFLQEVLGEHQIYAKLLNNWPSATQFEYLADSIWPHHAYGKNALYDAGHHGNALLSKYRIMHWSNEDFSTNKLERRGVLHGVIKLPNLNVPLHCLCVHFGLTTKGRKLQLEKLCKKIIDTIPQEAPLLVAGDFNDWGLIASRILKQKLGLVEAFAHTKGRHVATFPSFFPILHLDRIYIRGLHVVAAKVMRGKVWRKLSDHAAISAELRVETNLKN